MRAEKQLLSLCSVWTRESTPSVDSLGFGVWFWGGKKLVFLFVCFIVLCVIVKLMICVVEGSFFFSYFFCFTLSNCNVCPLVLDFFVFFFRCFSV